MPDAKKKISRGMRNNNPLNIEQGEPWQGLAPTQTDRRFCQFLSLEYGYRAAFIIIKNYMKMKPPVDTVSAIINRWAPPTENDTQKYIAFVCKRAGLEPSRRLKWSEKNAISRLIWAMAQFETGEEQSLGRVENAYALANRS